MARAPAVEIMRELWTSDCTLEGTQLVRDTTARTVLPVIAIGGITPVRVTEVAGAGAQGVAVLGGVWRAGDPAAAAAEYVAAVQAAWPQQGSDDLHDGRTR